MFKLRKDVLFDNQNQETKRLLMSLGFKEGDNLSEITENFLKKKNRDLSYYFDDEVIKVMEFEDLKSEEYDYFVDLAFETIEEIDIDYEADFSIRYTTRLGSCSSISFANEKDVINQQDYKGFQIRRGGVAYA